MDQELPSAVQIAHASTSRGIQKVGSGPLVPRAVDSWATSGAQPPAWLAMPGYYRSRPIGQPPRVVLPLVRPPYPSAWQAAEWNQFITGFKPPPYPSVPGHYYGSGPIEQAAVGYRPSRPQAEPSTMSIADWDVAAGITNPSERVTQWIHQLPSTPSSAGRALTADAHDTQTEVQSSGAVTTEQSPSGDRSLCEQSVENPSACTGAADSNDLSITLLPNKPNTPNPWAAPEARAAFYAADGGKSDDIASIDNRVCSTMNLANTMPPGRLHSIFYTLSGADAFVSMPLVHQTIEEEPEDAGPVRPEEDEGEVVDLDGLAVPQGRSAGFALVSCLRGTETSASEQVGELLNSEGNDVSLDEGTA